jgi:hypothetical protein
MPTPIWAGEWAQLVPKTHSKLSNTRDLTERIVHLHLINLHYLGIDAGFEAKAAWGSKF